MTKKQQVTHGPDWTAIFKRRPDLEPPGYHETCVKLKLEKEQSK